MTKKSNGEFVEQVSIRFEKMPPHEHVRFIGCCVHPGHGEQQVERRSAIPPAITRPIRHHPVRQFPRQTSRKNAVASAIKVDTAATYTVPDTVTRAEATAIGKQSARALGVFVQGSAGNRLTLDSLDISSKAITENGKSISYGIFSDKSSSVSVNEGTITASSQSKTDLVNALVL